MSRTHADIAAALVLKLPPGVFAHAARDAVLHQDFVTLKRMLPGVQFATIQVSPGEWELAGTCADGSTCIWGVGG
jgi:hypothetical protein